MSSDQLFLLLLHLSFFVPFFFFFALSGLKKICIPTLVMMMLCMLSSWLYVEIHSLFACAGSSAVLDVAVIPFL